MLCSRYSKTLLSLSQQSSYKFNFGRWYSSGGVLSHPYRPPIFLHKCCNFPQPRLRITAISFLRHCFNSAMFVDFESKTLLFHSQQSQEVRSGDRMTMQHHQTEKSTSQKQLALNSHWFFLCVTSHTILLEPNIVWVDF